MSRFVLSLVFSLSGFGFALCAAESIHWAYQPPRRSPLPTVRDDTWPKNALDRFILAKLEAAQLAPAPLTERAKLARRVTIDLTGLPPTLDELDDFLSDDRPEAYERLVARLVASPSFGERMALPWLDLARYADTHGFLIDSHRDMSRWRDWVIDAFNQNQPFDQFTIEQLAGDLLPQATPDQRLATGFNRNHMINYENGAIPEEYRVEYVADRAITTANVWMGLTFQCARCHDHKYDALSTREFYQWFAFFNQVPEQGLDGSLGNAAPLLAVPTAEQQRALFNLESRIATEEQRQTDARLAAQLRPEQLEAALRRNRTEPAAIRAAFLTAPFESAERVVHAADAAPVQNANAELLFVPGRKGQALLLDGKTWIELTEFGPRENSAGFSISAWVFPTTEDWLPIASLSDSRRQPRLEIALGELRPVFRIPRSAVVPMFEWRSSTKLQPRSWQHLAVVFNPATTPTMRCFLDGRELHSEATESLPAPATWRGVWRLGGNGEQGFRGMLDEMQFFAGALTALEVAALADADPLREALAMAPDRRSPTQWSQLADAFLRQSDVAYRERTSRIEQLRRELAQRRIATPTAMVMEGLVVPRETFVLRQGAFDRRGDRVSANTPDCLPPLPGEPRDRLALARWLVLPDHPLTARVMVNRLWQQFFGYGLVRTPEDFGVRGEVPTHPELLDWLAVEFVASGWDVKHVVRLMVSSATYRQASAAALVVDPENRFLSRQNRMRLDAETIRDAGLSSGGLLDRRIGGPSVFPYQPAGLWEEVSFNPTEFSAQNYLQSHGADLYRRGLYTFWKRTLPPPALTIFDAPTRETCIAARTRTNTPLQALVLMNDPTLIEAARGLATRVLREAGATSPERLAWAFRQVTSRPAAAEDTADLLGLLKREQARFRADPAAAKSLLTVGEMPHDPRLDSAELAAWVTVANVLLSLDEAIHR